MTGESLCSETSLQAYIFIHKMILKRLLISEGDSALHAHCSGLLGDRACAVNMIVLLEG